MAWRCAINFARVACMQARLSAQTKASVSVHSETKLDAHRHSIPLSLTPLTSIAPQPINVPQFDCFLLLLTHGVKLALFFVVAFTLSVHTSVHND